MSLTAKQKKDIAVGLIGYGTPKSNIWIMGYEESGNGRWACNMSDENFLKYKAGSTNEMCLADLEKPYRTTYGGYKRLLNRVFPEYKGTLFVTNLLPFGKKNSNEILLREECEIFGFSNYAELYTATILDRHLALIKFFEKNNWKDKYIFFCIGNSNNKVNELKQFLSKLYDVKEETLFSETFYIDKKSITDKSKYYLLNDIEFKKFITYQASSGIHFDRAIKRIKEILNQ